MLLMFDCCFYHIFSHCSFCSSDGKLTHLVFDGFKGKLYLSVDLPTIKDNENEYIYTMYIKDKIL